MTSEGSNETRMDVLSKGTCIGQSEIGVKSNMMHLFRRNREAEFKSCYWSLVGMMAPQ
jgi:hypothetical protein